MHLSMWVVLLCHNSPICLMSFYPHFRVAWSETLELRAIPLVKRPDASLVQTSEGFVCNTKYSRANILVCKACDTLASVSCAAETVAHLLLALKETLPTLRRHKNLRYRTSRYGSHGNRMQQITGSINTDKGTCLVDSNAICRAWLNTL